MLRRAGDLLYSNRVLVGVVGLVEGMYSPRVDEPDSFLVSVIQDQRFPWPISR